MFLLRTLISLFVTLFTPYMSLTNNMFVMAVQGPTIVQELKKVATSTVSSSTTKSTTTTSSSSAIIDNNVGSVPSVYPSQSASQSQPQSQSTSSFLSPRFGLLVTTSIKLPNTETLIASLRGGDVFEPSDADDVDSILVKAKSASKLVVIDFSATWCGPCKMIAPLFHDLSEQYDDVVFVKVDVDENPVTAQKYGVSAMPTFVFLKGGEVVDRLMGANPERLQELIEEHK